jgi:hypothetical protein
MDQTLAAARVHGCGNIVHLTSQHVAQVRHLNQLAVAPPRPSAVAQPCFVKGSAGTNRAFYVFEGKVLIFRSVYIDEFFGVLSGWRSEEPSSPSMQSVAVRQHSKQTCTTKCGPSHAASHEARSSACFRILEKRMTNGIDTQDRKLPKRMEHWCSGGSSDWCVPESWPLIGQSLWIGCSLCVTPLSNLWS